MENKIKKLRKAYENHKFESSMYTTPEFKSFATKYRNVLKAIAERANVELVKFSAGHFDLYGFFRNKETGKFCYVSIFDVRGDVLEAFDRVLVRTAAHDKDFTGGSNWFCSLENLSDRVAGFTS